MNNIKILFIFAFILLGAIFLFPKTVDAVATLQITLPPTEIATPNQLRFGRDTFTFDENCTDNKPCFRLGPTVAQRIEVVRETDPSSQLQFYVIKVNNIQKGPGQMAKINDHIERFVNSFNTTAKAYAPPPASNICILSRRCLGDSFRGSPWGWKLTFRTRTTAELLALVNQNRQLSGSFIVSNDNRCSEIVTDTQVGRFACLTTKVDLITTEEHNIPAQSLTQSIGLPRPGGVVFDGNVAGLDLRGFRVSSPDALVLGGNIENVEIGNQIKDYIRTGSAFSWTEQLTNQLNNLFNTNFARSTSVSPGQISAIQNWNLNSVDSNPTNPRSNTFSSPPEGKVWSVDGDLALNRVTFSGSGTILVKGNLSLDGLNCAPGTRLGFVATGNIRFNNNDIDCGIYLSLDSIIFNSPQNTDVEAKGIFIARNDIVIPAVAPARNMTIKYDTFFAQNPTEFFIEALKLIFKTTS